MLTRVWCLLTDHVLHLTQGGGLLWHHSPITVGVGSVLEVLENSAFRAGGASLSHSILNVHGWMAVDANAATTSYAGGLFMNNHIVNIHSGGILQVIATSVL